MILSDPADGHGDADVYLLESALRPMGDADKGSTQDLPLTGNTLFLNGEVKDLLVVSVPEHTTVKTATELAGKVRQVSGKQVLVLSHNTAVLRATKLGADKVAKLNLVKR